MVEIIQTLVLRLPKQIESDAGDGAAASTSISREGTFGDDRESWLNSVPITELEYLSLKNDSNIDAVAPIMECSLLEPIASQEAAELNTAPDAVWGVEAVKATDSPFTGKGTVVAILDTGIDREHELFEGLNIVEKDFTGEGDGDMNGHGTHCAGTVVGGVLNGRQIGIAPGVDKILVGKVLNKNGRGTSQGIADGITWAVTEGANVISMSIGIDFPGQIAKLKGSNSILSEKAAVSKALDGYRDTVELFQVLVNYVTARSNLGNTCILIAASGNESERPSYKVSTSPPAAADGVISVGAVKKLSEGLCVSEFSNSNVQICAPGSNIVSAKMGGGLISLNGTSMATPHVAGVAALWFEQLSSSGEKMSYKLFCNKLLQSATKEAFISDSESHDVGRGLVQAPSAA